MKILLICSESYSTRGGPLARSVGCIASAYRKLGASVLGFSPFFTKFEQESDFIESGRSSEKLRGMEYSALKRIKDEDKWNLFIRFDEYFARDGVYGDKHEKSFMDNHLRFSFLASAAMDYCIKSNFKPDAIHVHEWCGVAGALSKTVYREHFANVPVVLTIHNVKYDFHCTARHINKIGLNPNDFNIEGYEFWGKVSMLKAAILYSDKVVFTSDAYLNYLLFTDLPGGMRGFLESQSSKLLSIQNGLDYDVWGMPEEIVEAKKKHKDELRAELGLEADGSLLVYSQVDHDSSTGVISTILANLLNMNLQLVMGISENDTDYPYFAAMQEKNRSKMALLPITDKEEGLHHRLAAADIFFSINSEDPSLSLFLKAAAAGSLPLSNKRTDKSFPFLKPFSEQSEESKDQASAFISEDASPDIVLKQIQLAESVFSGDKSLWNKLVSNASSLKLSWDDTAEKYFSTFVPNS